MFWELYGSHIIDAVLGLVSAGLTAIAGYVALQLKNYINSKKENETVKHIVQTAVRAGEQMYKNIHGEEKFNLVFEGAADMLLQHGIQISEFELKWLIESAVSEFNDAFNKPINTSSDNPEELSEVQKV